MLRFLLALLTGMACLAQLFAQPILNTDLSSSLIAIDNTRNPAIYTARFRSLDGGATWLAFYLRPPGQSQPPLAALAVDPQQPQIVYYATTAELGGVWKSIDRGATWTTAGTGLPSAGGAVSDFFVATRGRYGLYARVADAVYLSTDGAKTWIKKGTLPGSGGVFRIVPQRPAVQYYVLRGNVWRSDDEGGTWRQAGVIPLAPPGEGFTNAIADLQSDVGNSEAVYATEVGPWFGGTGFAGFWKSTTGGASWGFQALVNRWILMDPAGGPNIYLSQPEASQIHKSGDHGVAWRAIRVVPETLARGVHLTASEANPRTLFATTGRGVYRSNDEAETWQPLHGVARGTLNVPWEGLSLQAAAGGQTIRVLDIQALEDTSWKFGVEATVEGSAPWLKLSPSASSTPLKLTVTASALSLSAGTYTSAIRFASPDTAHGPLTIPVTFAVSAQNNVPQFLIGTVAGRGTDGDLGDGGPALQSAILFPYSAAPGAGGRVLLTDTDHHRVREVSLDGIIRTVVGNGTAGFSGDGSPALNAQLNSPRRVLPDSAGGYFIADYGNNRVRRVDAAGVIRTFAEIPEPSDLALDTQGNLYVANYDPGRVVRFTPAGVASATFTGPSGQTLRFLESVAVDARGVVYCGVNSSRRVYRLEGGVFVPFAGTGTAGYNGDEQPAALAQLYSPMGLAADASGNLYIADSLNHRIRMVDIGGIIHTVAGTGIAGFIGDDGPAVLAKINFPARLHLDSAGAIWFGDRWNYRIRKLSPLGRNVPRILPGGIVNGASFSPGVSPGSLFSIFGEDLAKTAESASGFPWPTVLGGAKVRVGGREIPLYYASPTQINGQLPFETAAGSTPVVVSVDGQDSAPLLADVREVAPGIFQYGVDRAVAQNQDGAINASGSPAAVNSVVVVYLTGIGPLDQTVATGAVAPSNPLARASRPAAASIGGKPATVHYVGLAPGWIGLAQANISVPDLEPGDHALTIMIGDSESQSTLITVGPR